MPASAARRGLARRRFAFAALLCVGASMITVGAAAAPRTETTSPPSGIAVTLDVLDPVVPVSKSVLTLQGTLTNNTDRAISSVTVNVTRSASHLTSSTSVGEIAVGQSTPTQTFLPDGSFQVPGQMAAHTSKPWIYKKPMTSLGLNPNGVYSLQVEAVVTDDSSTKAVTSSFLPWFPDKSGVHPTGVVWLYPLVDWPGRDADNVLLSDRTPVEISPGGRLKSILDAGLGGTNQLTWVIDPELMETATVMTKGYSVLQPSGDPTNVPNSPAAVDFIGRASAGLKSVPVLALQYADPDVNALTKAKLNEDIVRATTVAPDELAATLGRPVTGGFAWPPGGRPDRPTLDVLQGAGIKTVLMNEDAMPPDSDPGFTPSGTAVIRTQTGQMTALLADQGLTDALSSPQATEADATLARQRFLGELGVITSELTDQPRTVIAAPTIRWQPASSVVAQLLVALRTSNWARSVPLNASTAAPSDVSRTFHNPSAKQRRGELPSAYLQKVKVGEQQLAVLASILNDPTDLTARFSSAFQRTESGAWRGDLNAGELLLNRVMSELATQTAQARVVSGGTVSFSGSTGKVPVTIANDLDRPVSVGVKLTANPAVRLVSEPKPAITIPANHKISTEIPAQVLGDGGLDASVQLTTPTGQDYGVPSKVRLRSTAYAGAAAWVVGIAFVALTAMIVFNAFRRRRDRAAERAGRTNE